MGGETMSSVAILSGERSFFRSDIGAPCIDKPTDLVDIVGEADQSENVVQENSSEIINVVEDKLNIDSNMLEVNKVYDFEYLDAQMFLFKRDNGSIDIYQVVN